MDGSIANKPTLYSDFVSVPLVAGRDDAVEHLLDTYCTPDDLEDPTASKEATAFKESVDTLKRLLAGDNATRDFVSKILIRQLSVTLGFTPHNDLQEKLLGKVGDPENWDMIFFTAWDIKKPTQSNRDFHRDGAKYGDVRIGFSKEKSTVFKVGAYSSTNSPTSYREIFDEAGMAQTKVISPNPGEVVVWDGDFTLHKQPDVSLEDLNRFNGPRRFFTASVGFQRTIDRVLGR